MAKKVRKTASKKQVHVILFEDNCLKIINGDWDENDDPHVDNPKNFVCKTKTSKELKSIISYPSSSGNVGNPRVENSEVDSEIDRLRAYTAYCYGPCNPVGIPCPAGLYPICQNGVLSCGPFRNPSKPASSKPVQKPSKKKK